MKTECTHCKKKFLGWRAYAEHLLEKHLDDEIRCEWARYVLSPESNNVEPRHSGSLSGLFRRRQSIDAELSKKVKELSKTAPDKVKTLRKMPKYIKKQYEDAGVKIEK